jgi:hypothetical protein
MLLDEAYPCDRYLLLLLLLRLQNASLITTSSGRALRACGALLLVRRRALFGQDMPL